MSIGEKRITEELGISDVLSMTFDIYLRDLKKYLILFLSVQAVTGVLTFLVHAVIVLPTIPSTATPTQVLNAFPGFLGALILSAAVTLILYPIAYGGAVKLASEEI